MQLLAYFIAKFFLEISWVQIEVKCSIRHENLFFEDLLYKSDNFAYCGLQMEPSGSFSDQSLQSVLYFFSFFLWHIVWRAITYHLNPLTQPLDAIMIKALFFFSSTFWARFGHQLHFFLLQIFNNPRNLIFRNVNLEK